MNFRQLGGENNREKAFFAVAITTVACFSAAILMLFSDDLGGNVPVWPSIGIGFACALYFGRIALFGIFLGNALSYIIVSLVGENFDEIFLQATWIILLSLVTMIQAWIGLSFIEKNELFPQRFRVPDKITQFYYYAAVLPSIFSATTGNLIYALILGTRQDDYPLQWLLWWTGDFSSIVIFTTAIIAYIQFSQRRKILVLIVLLISFASSIAINSLGIARDKERQEYIFEQQLVSITNAVQQKKEIYRTFLIALDGFVKSHDVLSKSELIDFASTTLENDPVIKRIGTLKNVPASELEQFQQRMLLEHGYEITVRNENNEDDFYLEYFEPDSNNRVIGANISWREARQDAYLYAINNNIHGMTSPEFAPGIQDTPIVTIFYPDRRGDKVEGLGLLSINLQGLMDEIFEQAMDNGVYFSIYDVNADEETLAFESDADISMIGDIKKTSFEIFNRNWEIRALFGPTFKSKHFSAEPLYTGIGGIIIASLVAFGVVILSGQRQYLAQVVRQRTSELEVANKSKSEFLANMSHDLRTPLNAILGFSDIMNKEMFGKVGIKKYEDYINDIYNSSEYLLSLINDILDFSTIDAGKRDLVLEQVDIRENIENCVRNLSALSDEKNIHCNLSVQDNMPNVIADARALKQVIINILSNSIKFTPLGGSINIIVHANDKSASIEIKDSGIGISEENLKNIFDPFTRADNNPLLAKEGTGLGLSIVYALIKLHGGAINIESEQNKGTIVTVELPLKQPI